MVIGKSKSDPTDKSKPQFLSLNPGSDPLPSCLTGTKNYMPDRAEFSPAVVTNAGNALSYENQIHTLIIEILL